MSTLVHSNCLPLRTLLRGVFFATLLIVMVGCNRGPAMSQVSGKVFYKDGTVPAGAVSVVRMEPTGESTAEVRKVATGPIQPDGSFTMYTRLAGDGVVNGEYYVTFTVIKAIADPKPLIPNKYRFQAETPFKITVDGDLTDLKFEIEPLPGVKGKPAVAGSPASNSAS